MVDYIRGNGATDSFTREDDRRTRRREAEYAQNRQFAVDDATRRGLRRILASGTTAPASANQPAGGVNLPSASFDATGGETITPTPVPQTDIEPTIAPTPIPTQPVASPAYVADTSPLGGAGLAAALGGDGMPPPLPGPMNQPASPMASPEMANQFFGGMARDLSNIPGRQPPSAQPMGYDTLDSRLPGLGPSVSSGAGQDEVAGGAGADLIEGGGYGVPAALIQQESGGRQADRNGRVLTSSAGAIGVRQIMPATGEDIARKHGIEWNPTLFYDPGPAGQAYNEQLGDLHWNDLMDYYGGNQVAAAAAYNAGQGRVDQYLRHGRPLPAETENYLNAIFGNSRVGAAAPRGNGRTSRGDLRQMVADRPTGAMQYGPLLDELSQVPGGGQAALQLLGNMYGRDQRLESDQLQLEQTFARDDDAMERLAMTALAHGDMDIYDYWAKKSGLQLPQEVLADRRQSSLYARGALLAEQFYKADPQQAAKFIQGYMQGGPAAGFQAAGAPTSNQRVTLRDVQVGDQRLIARIGQNGQSLGFVTGADNQPLQSATGTSGRFGAGQDASVKRRDYEALIPQLGEALARATVYGQNGLNPGERYLRAWLENAPKLGIAVNDQTLGEAKKTADLINQQLGAEVAVPASQSVTDPGVQAPEGFDVQPQRSRAWADGPDGSIYTDDGGQTWFNEDGSPYETAPADDVQPLYQPGA